MKLLKILCLFIWTFINLKATNPFFEQNKTKLNEIINDLKAYKTKPENKHRGHLYEHSMWVEQYLSTWMSSQNPIPEVEILVKKLTQDLTSREKQLLALSGLLHDIGKAGDLDFANIKPMIRGGYNWKDASHTKILYFGKIGHPEIGLDYIMGYKKYFKVDGTIFDFNLLFEQLKISKQEQKTIAFLVGNHGWLTNVFNKRINNAQDFFNVIDYLKNKTQITGYINKKLVTMSILITLADSCATFIPITQGTSIVFESFIFCEKNRDYPGQKKTVQDNIKNMSTILTKYLEDSLKLLETT